MAPPDCGEMAFEQKTTSFLPKDKKSPTPTTEPLQTLLTRIITRLLKVLTRHDAFREEETGIPYLADPDDDPALTPVPASWWDDTT